MRHILLITLILPISAVCNPTDEVGLSDTNCSSTGGTCDGSTTEPTAGSSTETGDVSTETGAESGTEESTTEESTTEESTTEVPGIPGEGVPECGNGTVDDGEECDGPNGPCTPECTLNICGDGYLYEGVEVCDEGEGNGDYGGTCDSNCSTENLEYCGDGILQPEEVCEVGQVMDDVPCNPDLCIWGPYRIVFRTSKPVPGDLQAGIYEGPETGVARADLICQQLASEAGLVGTFHAWLSDDNNGSDSDAAARIGAEGEPPIYYVMPGGGVLASSWAELLAEGPKLPIKTDEHGDSIESPYAWSNTGVDGKSLGSLNTCENWTSLEDFGAVGTAVAGELWTNNGLFFCANATLVHLYCIQGG